MAGLIRNTCIITVFSKTFVKGVIIDGSAMAHKEIFSVRVNLMSFLDDFYCFRNKIDISDRIVSIKEMFFALKLIQSYGSGIRRAKRAMKANGSPKLVFGPDNDTDDYTQVSAYINEEFARIQTKEEKA